jgi:hypothetical protein
MYAIHAIVDGVNRPTLGERFGGSLQPEDQPWLIPGANEVGISVAIHINHFAVNQTALRIRIQNDLRPLGRDQQACCSTSMANDIDAVIAGEVRRNASATMSAVVHGMLDPIGTIGLAPKAAED